MTGLNKILMVLILLQVALVWGTRQEKNEVTVKGRLLDEGEFVISLEFDDGHHTIRMEKDSEQWVFPRAGRVEVQKEQVDHVVSALQKATLGRAVVKNPASHRRLKVADDEYHRRVVINDKVSFYLGTSPSQGVSHIRLVDTNEVYQVDGLSMWHFGVRRSNWVDSKIIDVRKPDIQEFTMISENGSFYFTKNKEDKYEFHDTKGIPEGKEFDAIAFGIWVNKEGSWFLSDVVDREVKSEYGFDNPTVILKYKLLPKEEEEDGDDDDDQEERDAIKLESFEMVVGAKVPDKNEYYARTSDQVRIITVPQHRIQTLLERDRMSFYKDIKKEE